MSNFVRKGQTVHFEAESDLDNKQLLRIGNFVGVVSNDYEEGDDAVLEITGARDLPMATGSGEDADIGDPLYFDESEGELTTDHNTGENAYAAVAQKSVGESDDQVRASLLGVALDESAVFDD